MGDGVDFGRNKGFFGLSKGTESFGFWSNRDFQIKRSFFLLKFIFPEGFLHVN